MIRVDRNVDALDDPGEVSPARRPDTCEYTEFGGPLAWHGFCS